MMKNDKPIYIFTSYLITPVFVDAIIGLIRDKASLRYIQVGGTVGKMLNVIFIIISIYLFNKFCIWVKNVNCYKNIIYAYINVIFSFYGLTSLLFVIVYVYIFFKYPILNSITIYFILLALNYVALTMMVCKIIKKWIQQDD